MLPCGIVIEFEKWDGEELHIFGNSQNLYSEKKYVSTPRGHTATEKRRTPLGHLYKEKFLALFRFGDVRRHKWILSARERMITFEARPVEDAHITHHERFKVRTPPLSEAVSDFPVVVDPMGGIELARVSGWCQPVI